MASALLTELEQEIEQILLATDWREWEANEEAWELSVRCGVDPDTGDLLLDTDSRTLPDIPNKPDKTNWVEKAGGLPSYIKRIAKHLHFEKGFDVSRAIAIAVNTVKRWCTSGEVTEHGKGALHGVTAATKALACKAVAAWEAKRGAGRAAGAVHASGKTRMVVFEGVYLSQEDADLIRELTESKGDGVDFDGIDFSEVDFDPERYEAALSQARADAEGDLDLSVFREDLHPRLHGKFTAKGVEGDEAHIHIEPFQEGKHNLSIDHAFGGSSVALTHRERKVVASAIRDQHATSQTVHIHDDAKVHIEPGSEPTHQNIHIEHPFGSVAAEYPRADAHKLADMIDPPRPMHDPEAQTAHLPPDKFQERVDTIRQGLEKSSGLERTIKDVEAEYRGHQRRGNATAASQAFHRLQRLKTARSGAAETPALMKGEAADRAVGHLDEAHRALRDGRGHGAAADSFQKAASAARQAGVPGHADDLAEHARQLRATPSTSTDHYPHLSKSEVTGIKEHLHHIATGRG